MIALENVSKVNSRIKRMWEFTDGKDPTLDTLKSQLEIIVGHDIIGAPTISKKDIATEQLETVQSLIDGYIASPYSTIKGAKAMANRGFAEFSNRQELSEKQVVAFNTIFKSPVWQKIREQYYYVSENAVDSVQELIDADFKTSEILGILKDYNKSSNMDKSLRQYIDNALQNK